MSFVTKYTQRKQKQFINTPVKLNEFVSRIGKIGKPLIRRSVDFILSRDAKAA